MSNLKILYVGYFSVPWSADHSRARGFKKLGHRVFKFYYRYNKKLPVILNDYQDKKLNNNKIIIRILKKTDLIFRELIRLILLKIPQNIPFFQKILEIKKFYLNGNWKMNKQLIQEIKMNKYDLIFLAKSDTINYHSIKKFNHFSKTWYFIMDPLKTALEINADKYASLCTGSSATFSNVTKLFKKRGATAFHITEGYDIDIYKPDIKSSEKDIDVVFAGSKSPKRERFINFLKKNGISVICYGSGWKNSSVYLYELADVYRRSKIVLNFVRDLSGFSDRVLLAMGTGSFLLSEYCHDLKKFFKKEEHLDWFQDMDNMLEKIKYYIQNPALRENIAQKGYEFVKNNFSWEKIMEKIINLIFE
ncbi:MAG: glycosyltransferase [Promethearchaeota archaeon]